MRRTRLACRLSSVAPLGRSYRAEYYQYRLRTLVVMQAHLSGSRACRQPRLPRQVQRRCFRTAQAHDSSLIACRTVQPRSRCSPLWMRHQRLPAREPSAVPLASLLDARAQSPGIVFSLLHPLHSMSTRELDRQLRVLWPAQPYCRCRPVHLLQVSMGGRCADTCCGVWSVGAA